MTVFAGKSHTLRERDQRDGSYTVSELDRRHQVWLDAQPMASACGVEGCGWSFTGPTVDALAAAAEHRGAAHPELVRRRKGRSRTDDKVQAARRARDEREAAEREAKAERGRERSVLGEAAGDEAVGPDAAVSPSTPYIGPAEQAVLDLLEAGPMRVMELARGRGVSDAAVSQNMTTLLRKGRVRRVSRGVYALAGWTPVVAVSERESTAERATPLTGTVARVEPTGDQPSRSETAPAKTGLLRMLARDVRRVADTLDAFVEAYESDLLEALEREAA